MVVGVLGARAAATPAHRTGGLRQPRVPGDAATALAQPDAIYAAWTTGVRGLDEAGLRRPCGPAEGPWTDSPMAMLILHVDRQVLHHGAEIALLRDPYRWRG